LRGRSGSDPLANLPGPERLLATRDPTLAQIIFPQSTYWPCSPTEDPIWGLIRIVMAQQVSTLVACRIAARVKSEYPCLSTPSPSEFPDPSKLRAFGLPQRRAQCCVDIVARSHEILTKIENGFTWDRALEGVKGIGPWTISVFKIMVLRDPDVLPLGDVGLERAIINIYGGPQSVEQLSERWRPFRSVACWYLWRTLGNEQLG
jgi:DNA-3-methyladenine glycosylase II